MRACRLLILALVALLIVTVSVRVDCLSVVESFQSDTRCLSCIRNVTSSLNLDNGKRCEGYYCGQYQISYPYWAEAGKPGPSQGSRDYEKCARDRNCSELTVRAYFKKFKRDCNHDGVINCLDMAALHKAGPGSCSSDWFFKSRYWQAFNKTLCTTQPEGDTQQQADIDQALLTAETLQAESMRKNESLSTDCLDCICEAVSGCNTSKNNCGTSTVCGPYAISQAYWVEGKRPGASWTACTRTKECSTVTMKNYMEKHMRDCNGDGLITCEDYAAIHRRGPRGCNNRDLFKDHYWNKFNSCRAQRKPIKDTSTVKVSDTLDEGHVAPVLASRDDNKNLPSTTLTYSTTTTSVAPTTLATSKSNIDITIQDSSTTTTSSVATTMIDTMTQPEASPAPSQTTFQYTRTTNPKVAEAHSTVANRHDSVRTAPSFELSSLIIDVRDVPNRRGEENTQIGLQDTHSPTSEKSELGVLQPLITVNHPHHLQQPKQHDAVDDYSQVQQSNPTYQTLPKLIVPTYPEQPQMVPVAPQMGVEEPDYHGHDYPYTTTDKHGPSPDRVPSNFDHVVTGIVGSPDFGKSYPPVPNLVIQTSDKQPATNPSSQLQTNNEKPRLTGQRVNTNHSRGPHQTTKPMGTPQVDNSNPKLFASRVAESNAGLIVVSSGPVPVQNGPANPMHDSSSLANTSTSFDRELNESNRIANECLECICDASSNCDNTVQCISKQRDKNRCGLYMISWNQYQESDISLTSLMSITTTTTTTTGTNSEDSMDEKMYYECTTDKTCAERLIRLYIEKHQKDCNNDGKIDCYDIAAIHRVGPDQCNSGKFLGSQYWKDFTTCYSSDKATTTSQPQSMPIIT